ncbi:TPA: hypothetical protein ACGO3A_000057 [Streptococcus suis]
MKKFIRIVALALVALFIVGCGQKEAEKKTDVYSYQQDVAGVKQEITETLTYKGDEFLAIGVKIVQPTDEATKATFEGVDFDTVKDLMLSYLKETEGFKQLLKTEGVETTIDMTEDYTITIEINIDLTKADLEALSDTGELGFDFTSFEDTTPEAYIQFLKDEYGATLVK